MLDVRCWHYSTAEDEHRTSNIKHRIVNDRREMPLNLAILGFAHGHVGVYCEQWRKHFSDDVRLVAGWDHDAQRAAAARERYGIGLHGTAADLLSRRDIDAVVIGAE